MRTALTPAQIELSSGRQRDAFIRLCRETVRLRCTVFVRQVITRRRWWGRRDEDILRSHAGQPTRFHGGGKIVWDRRGRSGLHSGLARSAVGHQLLPDRQQRIAQHTPVSQVEWRCRPPDCHRVGDYSVVAVASTVSDDHSRGWGWVARRLSRWWSGRASRPPLRPAMAAIVTSGWASANSATGGERGEGVKMSNTSN